MAQGSSSRACLVHVPHPSPRSDASQSHSAVRRAGLCGQASDAARRHAGHPQLGCCHSWQGRHHLGWRAHSDDYDVQRGLPKQAAHLQVQVRGVYRRTALSPERVPVGQDLPLTARCRQSAHAPSRGSRRALIGSPPLHRRRSSTQGWKPSLTIKHLLVGIQSLLDEPNNQDPAQEEPFKAYTHNTAEYEQKVKAQVALLRAV